MRVGYRDLEVTVEVCAAGMKNWESSVYGWCLHIGD